jgi:hypothetical protein
MIRVTIDFIPFGIEAEAARIGILTVWNEGTGTQEIGNYRWLLAYKTLDGVEVSRCGAIKGYDRIKGNAVDLVTQAMADARVAANETEA